MPNSVAASAPGKLLILGSYGVLDGAPALVMAHGPRLRTAASPGPAGQVELVAPAILDEACRFALGSSPGEGHPASPTGSLRYLGAVAAALEKPPWDGLRLETASDIPPGLGSSSALLVTSVAVRQRLAALAGGGSAEAAAGVDVDAVVQDAFEVLLRIQGGGSGADLAAATAGGAIHYRLEGGKPTWDALPNRLPGDLQMSVWRRGGKTDTAAAIRRWKSGEGKDLLPSIADCADEGLAAWRANDAAAFCAAVDEGQRLQIRLGAVDESDAAWMQQCRSIPHVEALISTGGGGSEAVAVWWRGSDPYADAVDWFEDLGRVDGRALAPGLELL